jgi:hypothetical protein
MFTGSAIKRCRVANDAERMKDYVTMALRMAGRMDKYYMIPSAFPWRFLLLKGTTLQQRRRILDLARHEWDQVLRFEQTYPRRLAREAPPPQPGQFTLRAWLRDPRLKK